MARTLFSKQDDWKLVHEDQDVRGWPVRDVSGAEVGRVADLSVDEAEARVDALLLEDGRELPVADVRIGEDAVHLGGSSAAGVATGGASNTVAVYDDYGRVLRRERVGGGDSPTSAGSASTPR